MQHTIPFKSWGRRVARLLVLGASVGALSACDDLLEVELPHLLTDAAIEGAGTAQLQINSAIALFECGYNAFGLMGMGAEDAMESIAGVYNGGHVYDETPDTGTCDTSSTSDAWFDQIMGARALLSTEPALLTPGGFTEEQAPQGVGRGVYDRIQNEWSLGAGGERLAAIGAIYTAATLSHMGEFLCEIAIDGSDIMSPTQVLNLAEAWVNRAINTHIPAFGDFTMPNGAAESAMDMAMALRARIRWANRDFGGAASDAQAVLASDDEFNAWITREAGETRRNKIWHNATEVGFSALQARVDWWDVNGFRPNPVTGQPWPSPIPFTGYMFLGIETEGETLTSLTWGPDLGPVVYAEPDRDAAGNPVLLGNTAVVDGRVLHFEKPIQGPTPEDVPDRYTGLDDDIPYMSWQELKLIQAKNDLENSNFASAIAHVNDIRAAVTCQDPATGNAVACPTISGAYAASLDTYDEVRYVLHEERKREFFAEGARYWSTKIQNTDIAWFPRAEGATPFQGYAYLGAVRQLFAEDEYTANPLWVGQGGLAARTTGCDAEFGSQAPSPRES